MVVTKHKVNEVHINKKNFKSSNFNTVDITIISEKSDGTTEEFTVALYSGTGRKMPKVKVNKIWILILND